MQERGDSVKVTYRFVLFAIVVVSELLLFGVSVKPELLRTLHEDLLPLCPDPGP